MSWWVWLLIYVAAAGLLLWYIWTYFATWAERDGGGPDEVPLWKWLSREHKDDERP